MFLQSRQMASTNDIARSDNPNPQFVIIFVQGLCEILILQSRLVLVRAKFDRLCQLRVQTMNFPTRRIRRIINIHLTGELMRGSLRAYFLRLYHVQSLQHHGIESHARQRHPPARPGQKERRRGPTHHENGAAHFRAEPPAPAHLGARAKEVCARSRYGARS
jgi:hypothetical protein